MIKGIEFDVNSLKDFEYNWNCTKYYTSIIDTVEARQFLINILENWENVNNDTKKNLVRFDRKSRFLPILYR